jgi:hypothetical protein
MLKYYIEMTPNSDPTAMEHVPAVDICDVCMNVFKLTFTRVARMIPEQYLGYQMLIVNSLMIMTDYLRRFRATLKNVPLKKANLKIMDVTGFDHVVARSVSSPMSLFYWEEMSLEKLETADLMTMLEVMINIMDTSLASLQIKVETDESKEPLQWAVDFMSDVKVNIHTVLPLIGVTTANPGVKFIRFTIQVISDKRTEDLVTSSLTRPNK